MYLMFLVRALILLRLECPVAEAPPNEIKDSEMSVVKIEQVV